MVFSVPKSASCPPLFHLVTFQCCSDSSIPNNFQVSPAPQLAKYLSEWAGVVHVPLIDNAIRIFSCDRYVSQLEGSLLSPEVIILLPKLINQLASSFSCSYLQRKRFGTNILEINRSHANLTSGSLFSGFDTKATKVGSGLNK